MRFIPEKPRLRSLYIRAGMYAAIVSLAFLSAARRAEAQAVSDIFDWLRRGISSEAQVEDIEFTELQRRHAIVTDGGLKIAFASTSLGTTNAYGPGGIRYFVTQLRLHNQSDQDIEIQSAEIELDADGDILHLGQENEQLSQIMVQVNNSHQMMSDLATPETIVVPAQEGVAVWLAFTDVPGSIRTPKLVLRMPVAGTVVAADITAFHSRILELTQERLGPGGCLCLMRINGELNSINANDLVDAMTASLDENISRFVISWPEGAPPISDHIVQWFLTSRMPPGFGWYSTSELLPTLPGDAKEMNIVNLPNNSGMVHLSRSINGIDQTTPSFADDESAVIDALQSVAVGMTSDALMEEIAEGHPLSRTAMLVHGAHLLPPSALPLVTELARAESEQLRLAAIRALGEFPEVEAIDLLTQLARTGSEAERSSAIEGLACSRFPPAHERLKEILAEEWTVPRGTMIEILARNPREEWNNYITDAALDPDNAVRLTAIRALAHLGHPDRLHLLTEALESRDEALRAEAFSQLLAHPDPGAQEIVITEMVRLIDEQGLTAEVQNSLGQYSDPRLTEALLRLFRSDRPGRDSTASLLIRIADDETIDEVLRDFDDLDQNEQANILQSLTTMEHPRLAELARENIDSNNQNLVRTAIGALMVEGSDESMQLVLDKVRSTENTAEWHNLCQQIVYTGGIQIEGILLDARNSDDVERRRIAVELLRQVRYRTPAGQVVAQAENLLYEQEWEKAIEAYNIALDIDDEHAGAYSARGGAKLQLDQVEEAEQDFLRALELDPYDGYAITGLASIMASRNEIEEALKKVDEHYDLLIEDFTFVYNVACVCGRGVKALEEQPDSEENSELRQRLVDRAVQELGRSIEMGYIDYDTIEQDPDLEALRDNPQFQELLDPLRDTADGEIPLQIKFDF